MEVNAIDAAQIELASPNVSFMPVHSLIRSKTAFVTWCWDVVANDVFLITRMGHRRKYPPIPDAIFTPGAFFRI